MFALTAKISSKMSEEIELSVAYFITPWECVLHESNHEGPGVGNAHKSTRVNGLCRHRGREDMESVASMADEAS